MASKGERQSGRRERKMDALRRRIVEVAVRLFDEKGYDNVLMEQIGEEVDIAKTTLYRYFPSKDAILSAFARQAVTDHAGEAERLVDGLPDTRSRLVALGEWLFDWVARHREIWLVNFSYEMQRLSRALPDESERSGVQRLFERTLAMGQASGELRADLPPEVMAAYFEINLVLLNVRLLLSRARTMPKESLSGLVDLFLSGARAPKGGRA